MKVAYVVSRFPHSSETFIVRELNAVAACGDFELELFSLFEAVDATLHPAARRWMSGLHRGGRRRAAAGATWLVRRPLRTLSSVGARSSARSRASPRSWRDRSSRSRSAPATQHGSASSASSTSTPTTRRYPALAAWTVWRLTGIGYSFTAHAHDIYIDRSFLPTLLRDARFAAPISHYNRRLLERSGGEATPLHVVHCGVDPAGYAYTPRTPPAAGPVRVLCVASLQEYKGHRHLLDALARGGPGVDRVELDLVGRGELRADLETRAAALGLDERVRFHGALTEPEVADLLGRAHAFVLPSIVLASGFMEGIPVSLMEAMACGVPVVATRDLGDPRARARRRDRPARRAGRRRGARGRDRGPAERGRGHDHGSAAGSAGTRRGAVRHRGLGPHDERAARRGDPRRALAVSRDREA